MDACKFVVVKVGGSGIDIDAFMRRNICGAR